MPARQLHEEAVQSALFEEAARLCAQRTVEAASLDEAVEAAREGFAELPASEVEGDAETRLNEEGVSVRLLRAPEGSSGTKDVSGPARAIVARAY